MIDTRGLVQLNAALVKQIDVLNDKKAARQRKLPPQTYPHYHSITEI